MIHEPQAKNSLPPLESLGAPQARVEQTGGRPGLLKRIGIYACLVLAIPLLPFIILYGLVKAIGIIPGAVARADVERAGQQAEYGFDFEKIVIQDCRDGRNCETSLRMNYHALKGFAASLDRMFRPGATGGTKVQSILPLGRALAPQQPGWHGHAEDSFSPLPCGLMIVTTTDRLLEVRDGWILSAAPDVWARLAAAWLEVADRRQPCLIVLDANQKDWCDPKSTGRFMVEYVPDLT